MSDQVQAFTAKEMADALGISRQSTYRRLDGIKSNRQKPVGKNPETAAWSIDVLPAKIAEALTRALKEEPSTFGKAIPEGAVTNAEKWREVLRPMIRIQHTAKTAELVEVGQIEYRRQFGSGISPLRLLRWLESVVKADNSRNDFERLNLYLDKRSIRTGTQQPKRTECDWSPLQPHIALLNAKAEWEAKDKWIFLHEAFQHADDLIAGPPPVESSRVLLSLGGLLWRELRRLAPSRNALRMLLERKRSAWLAGEKKWESMADRRQVRSNETPVEERFGADIELITGLAAKRRGNVALALRFTWKKKLLSQEFRHHYNYDMRRNKSYVPSAIRAAVMKRLEYQLATERGKTHKDKFLPYFERDPSDIRPGDWFVADDVTFNSYYWYFDEDGRKRITRGECLAVMDKRSLTFLGFILISDGHYSGLHIRTMILHIHDKVGLPHCGWELENGIWRSKLIDGKLAPDGLTYLEMEAGLHQVPGLRIRHAKPRNAKSKVVECAFGIIQKETSGERGYAGFHEREENFEEVQKIAGRCRRGTEDPEKHFYHRDQWVAVLSRYMDDYHEEPQNGRYLPGAAPSELFYEAQRHRPCEKLREEQRYLLATHRREIRVRPSHGWLKWNDEFKYVGPELDQFIGERVLAYFDIEFPDVLTIAARDGRRAVLKRWRPVPSSTADKETLAAGYRRIAACKKAKDIVADRINHRVLSTISRAELPGVTDTEAGAFRNEAVAVAKAEKTQRQRDLQRIRRAAVDANVRVPRDIDDPEEMLELIEMEKAVKRRLEQAQGISI